MLCPTKVPEKAGYFQAAVDRDPASTLLVDKKKLGRSLFAKCRNAVPVLGYHEIRIEIVQKVDLADCGKG